MHSYAAVSSHPRYIQLTTIALAISHTYFEHESSHARTHASYTFSWDSHPSIPLFGEDGATERNIVFLTNHQRFPTRVSKVYVCVRAVCLSCVWTRRGLLSNHSVKNKKRMVQKLRLLVIRTCAALVLHFSACLKPGYAHHLHEPRSGGRLVANVNGHQLKEAGSGMASSSNVTQVDQSGSASGSGERSGLSALSSREISGSPDNDTGQNDTGRNDKHLGAGFCVEAENGSTLWNDLNRNFYTDLSRRLKKIDGNQSLEQFRNNLNQTAILLLELKQRVGSVRPMSTSTTRSAAILVLGSWYDTLYAVEVFLEVMRNCCWVRPLDRDLRVNDSFPPMRFDKNSRSLSPQFIERPQCRDNQAKNSTHPDILTVSDAQKWICSLSETLKQLSRPGGIFMPNHPNLSMTFSPICQRLVSGDCSGRLKGCSLSFVGAAFQLVQFINDLVDFAVLLDHLRSLAKTGTGMSKSSTLTRPVKVAEITMFMEEAHRSLNVAYTPQQSCLSKRLCSEARKTLTYLKKLPFIVDGKKNQLSRVVSLMCDHQTSVLEIVPGSSKSKTPNATRSPATFIEGCLTTELTCADKLAVDCGSDLFLRTKINTRRSHSSFSPEEAHLQFIITAVGSSFVNSTWSSSAKQSECRLSCDIGLMNSNTPMGIFRFYFSRATEGVFFLVILFAAYLLISSAKNRSIMAKNPYRTYLYINTVRVSRFLLYVFSGHLGGGINACNSDGSLVLGVNEAGVLCRMEASALLATAIMDMLVYTWAVIMWRRTLMQGNGMETMHRSRVFGLTKFEILEVIFLVFFVSLPILFLTVANTSDLLDFDIEGSPSLKVCIYASYRNSPYLSLAVVVLTVAWGIAFLLFIRTLAKVLVEASKGVGRKSRRRNHMELTLLTWLRRHLFFFALLLMYMVLSISSVVEIFVRGETVTHEKAVTEYFNCRKLLSCTKTCEFRLPKEMSPILTLIVLAGLFIANLWSFAWAFFVEVEWKGLAQLHLRRVTF